MNIEHELSTHSNTTRCSAVSAPPQHAHKMSQCIPHSRVHPHEDCVGSDENTADPNAPPTPAADTLDLAANLFGDASAMWGPLGSQPAGDAETRTAAGPGLGESLAVGLYLPPVAGEHHEEHGQPHEQQQQQQPPHVRSPSAGADAATPTVPTSNALPSPAAPSPSELDAPLASSAPARLAAPTTPSPTLAHPRPVSASPPVDPSLAPASTIPLLPLPPSTPSRSRLRSKKSSRSGSSASGVKRPLNSFMLYRRDRQNEIPTNNHQSISRIIGQLWRNESVQVKKYYADLAVLERQRHMMTHPEYKFSPRKNQHTSSRPRKRRNSSNAGGIPPQDLDLLKHMTTKKPPSAADVASLMACMADTSAAVASLEAARHHGSSSGSVSSSSCPLTNFDSLHRLSTASLGDRFDPMGAVASFSTSVPTTPQTPLQGVPVPEMRRTFSVSEPLGPPRQPPPRRSCSFSAGFAMEPYGFLASAGIGGSGANGAGATAAAAAATGMNAASNTAGAAPYLPSECSSSYSTSGPSALTDMATSLFNTPRNSMSSQPPSSILSEMDEPSSLLSVGCDYPGSCGKVDIRACSNELFPESFLDVPCKLGDDLDDFFLANAAVFDLSDNNTSLDPPLWT
ncbi:transcription factor Ste11 [Schizosaccharomyces japonicus yFS275]|uniref:Transcription factor Ste11 n=1 Tax=Schizosaccharomyces japonicus (strain yFS275 / FY16936) TaxID=402676 RepID=B6K5N3_SCHJY|nr:transcription factor Ste11 [Schizosaccharomyces japonicus yFS275]EEB08837.2 transcription factor Ste11 [Schizosaccharomyces japonicus yFS275]